MALSLIVILAKIRRVVRLLRLASSQNLNKLVAQDIVLITGGSSGLGAELALALSKRVQQVVVVDLNPPLEPIPNVIYYSCDISNVDQVERVHEQIKLDIPGTVSVLVNNAGITYGKPLLELSYAEIDRILKVNLYSCFITIKTFLPDMIANKRGYVVSVASVLGYISPAKLSAYGASKSGLVALHESLTYELGPPSLPSSSGVKTLLICPGQLETQLFARVETPSRLIAPVLKPQYVASRIVDAMTQGQVGELRLPLYTNFIPLVRALPWQLAEFARRVGNIDHAMR